MLIIKTEKNKKKTEEPAKDEKFDIKAGDTVKVYQIIKEKSKKKKGGRDEIKERIQIFEGFVLARKHGSEIGATITVRKIIAGIGVEKIFPIHSPKIQKIEIIKRSKVRRAKLYYFRTAKGRKSRLKKVEIKSLPQKNIIVEKQEPKKLIEITLDKEKKNPNSLESTTLKSEKLEINPAPENKTDVEKSADNK